MLYLIISHVIILYCIVLCYYIIFVCLYYVVLYYIYNIYIHRYHSNPHPERWWILEISVRMRPIVPCGSAFVKSWWISVGELWFNWFMVGTIVHRVHRGLSYKKILGYLSLTTVHWFFFSNLQQHVGVFFSFKQHFTMWIWAHWSNTLVMFNRRFFRTRPSQADWSAKKHRLDWANMNIYIVYISI
jgi:hypothetical protein